MADKLTNIAHLEAVAEKSKTYTGGLVAEIATAVSDVVAEVDAIKADKPEAVALTIDTLDWYSCGGSDYPYAWDFGVLDITENDIVTVTVAPESLAAAAECGLCPTCDTYNEGFTLFAASVPTEDIEAEYYVVKGTVSE